MNRHNSFSDMMGSDRPRIVTLVSELIPRKLYRLEGNGPYVYQGQEEGEYVFVSNSEDRIRSVSRTELEKMLSSNAVVEVNEVSNEVTVPEYPDLDGFTVNTFITPMSDLWDRCGVLEEFNRTQLLQLDDMCRQLGLSDIPTPGESKYIDMISHPAWPLMKRYILYFSPDTELPENFA